MSLPLEGVRVLDLSRLLPGPFCSLLLADFGAEVIKVEDMGMGDYARWSPPYYEGAEESAKGALFLGLNRNKTSIRAEPQGRARAARCCCASCRTPTSCSSRSGPACSTASASATSGCARSTPGIVYCAITGYGLDGPLRDRSGHDMNYLGLDRAARPDRRGGRPARAGGRADRRRRRRRADGGVRHPRRAARARPLRRGSARRRLDGRRRAVVAGDDRRELPRRRRGPAPRAHPARRHVRLLPAVRLRRRLGDARRARAEVLPELLRRRRAARTSSSSSSSRRAATPTASSRRSSPRARATSGTAFAGEHDCCLEPVLDLDEVLDSELVRAREMVVEIEQPGADRPVRQLGVPVKLSRTPGDPRRLPGPGLGEHTDGGAARRRLHATRRSPTLTRGGAIGGLARGRHGVVPDMSAARGDARHDGAAEDARPRRAVGRQRGHDQALPARGRARRRRRASCARRATWPGTRRSSSSGSSSSSACRRSGSCRCG